MSVLLIVGPRRMLPPGELQWVFRRYRQTDRRTDARPLRFPLDVASVKSTLSDGLDLGV